MMAELDKNKTGTLDFPEFLGIMCTRMADRDSKEELAKVFRLFDEDGNGVISFKNLKRVCKELGETMTDEEMIEMIARADTKDDGQITLDEFYNIITAKNFA